jgi:ABC-type Fe3+/spermidine/putrescine transport system ATPase subunit
LRAGDAAWLSVRPEHLTLIDPVSDSPLTGVVAKKAYRGSTMETIVELRDGLELKVTGNAKDVQREVGDRVSLRVDPATSVILAK